MVLAALAASACGGGPSAGAPTERLWVSGVPTSAKAELSAFVTTRQGSGKFLGAFFHGSALRGHHDVFEWVEDGKDAAKLKFLQDGSTRRLRFETCEPTRGFDYCMIVKGDPTGAERYQSRKRWIVRRPGRGKIEPAMVLDAIAELSEDDEDLAAAFSTADAQ
ncbi:MAG TPA: hypothetical protein VFG69_14140 [Nannocystaceae bacterium]|nr:hypothetical protein [Nannocystaceae bacterium]